MINNMKFWEDKGKKAVETLISIGYMQCCACTIWKHPEDIGANKICTQCEEKNK